MGTVLDPAAAPPPLDAEGARKREVLLLALGALFVGFFVAAEILGNKLYRFDLFGLTPRSLGLTDDDHFVATTGIYAFPLTFVLTDIVNEYFGKRIVRIFTFLAIGVNVVLQPVIQVAIRTPTMLPSAAMRTVAFTVPPPRSRPSRLSMSATTSSVRLPSTTPGRIS
mgnify:CR=1 FL=1